MTPFKGRHFQKDIIPWAVRWYCKYGISYRELQDMQGRYSFTVPESVSKDELRAFNEEL